MKKHSPWVGYFALTLVAALPVELISAIEPQSAPAPAIVHSPHWKLGRKLNPGEAVRPSDSTSLAPTGGIDKTPRRMRHAYGFDLLSSTGAGQTIAIIDAYGSPTLQADLNAFCENFGIASTQVEILYPSGAPASTSSADAAGWAVETTLDVEWAHAMAPGAKIILVVAPTDTGSGLVTTCVNAAVAAGATQVSMSWGFSETASAAGQFDSYFNRPGVTFFAASGDSGKGVTYPSVSKYVVSVGGTSLTLSSSAQPLSELGWSGSGGGSEPLYAHPRVPVVLGQNSSYRGTPDISYNADPDTGVPVYNTANGWMIVGGTSASTPVAAALCAITNGMRTTPLAGSAAPFYAAATANYAGNFTDIVSGYNGYSCTVGWDYVTGLGVPDANTAAVALAGSTPVSTPPPTPTPPSPAPTPLPSSSHPFSPGDNIDPRLVVSASTSPVYDIGRSETEQYTIISIKNTAAQALKIGSISLKTQTAGLYLLGPLSQGYDELDDGTSLTYGYPVDIPAGGTVQLGLGLIKGGDMVPATITQFSTLNVGVAPAWCAEGAGETCRRPVTMCRCRIFSVPEVLSRKLTSCPTQNPRFGKSGSSASSSPARSPMRV